MQQESQQHSVNGSLKSEFCGKPVEEIQIPVPYGHISGIWWGPRNKQPILALHGWQDNAGTWERLVPLLPSDVSILAIDLPGHGCSSHYPPGQIYYLFWDGVYLIRLLTRYFNWDKVSILGHSLGGAIGFLYAGVYPNEIEKLIQIDIVNPTIREPSTEASKCSECIDRLLKYETFTEENMPCYEYEEMIDVVEDAYKGSVTRESCKILMKRGMAPSPKGKGYYFSRDVKLKGFVSLISVCTWSKTADEMSVKYDLRQVAGLGFVSLELIKEFARRIKCNVLNIKGKPGMSFEKPHYYHMILDEMRKNAYVEFYEVEGTHHLHLNNPERISEIVSRFILQPVKSKDEVPPESEAYLV